MNDLLDALRRDGICRLPPMPVEHVDELVAYLTSRPMHNAHVPWPTKVTETAGYADALERFRVFSVSMGDLTLAPHWFEYALGFHDLARAHFGGRFPRLYSLNAFWTKPGPDLFHYTQDWHRDGDDDQQLAIFMFGTDVPTPEHGGHEYQRGTHLTTDDNLGRDPHADPAPEIVELVVGPRGTAILIDGQGLHRGLPPAGARLLLWARWGISEMPRSYVWDKMTHLPKEQLGDRYPTDPDLRESVRLIVQ